MKKGPYHFLLIYPLYAAPSQRFRFEQFFPLLKQHEIQFTTSSFYDSKTFSTLYNKRNRFLLGLRLLKCFLRRCIHVFFLYRYQYIFIQRGASPFGPPLFEWIIRFIYSKPIIYDFDDAIWINPPTKQSAIKRFFKAKYKVRRICAWSYAVVAGNSFLYDYARQFSKNVFVIPTVVDTENRFIPVSYKKQDRITLGWTGSHTTIPYLEALEPVLYRLQQKYDIFIHVIANESPVFKNLRFQFLPWSEKNEVHGLASIDIGIMPSPNDEWAMGKCGFKAIQYMALQKPAVASAVGINNQIIDDGINGFLCASNEEWEKKLSYLIEHPEKIEDFGRLARAKVKSSFSLMKAETLWCDVLQVH